MDRRKFLISGGMVVGVATIGVGEAGCPSAEEWFQIAAGLVPIVLQTVGSFETANGGLPPSVEATITNFSNIATSILNDVAADIAIAKSDTSVIPKIDAQLANLQTQAQQLLSKFSGNNKVLGWINAILADVTDLVNLVPVFQQTTATATQRAKVTVVTVKVSLPTAKSYQLLFQHRLQSAKAL